MSAAYIGSQGTAIRTMHSQLQYSATLQAVSVYLDKLTLPKLHGGQASDQP